MGTWATDSFGNDDAADWLANLEEQESLGLLEETLRRVLEASDEYLEAPEAAEALAAAEVVAAAKGSPGRVVESRKSLVEWLDNVQPVASSELVALARRTVERVFAANSELRELWEESDEFENWQADVQNLLNRLNA